MKNKITVIKITAYLTVGLVFTTLTSTYTKASGEQTRTIDSLKKVIVTANHDTTKAKALLKLSERLYFANLDTSIQLSVQALQIYIKKNIEKGVARAYNHLGFFYRVKSDYKIALEYHKKGVEIQESVGDKKGLAASYNNIGLIYLYQSDYPRALEYYFKSLKIGEELGNKQGMARTHNNIGMIYNNQSDYPFALDYYFKSLKIFEELGDKQGLASSYGNIGAVYSNQHDYPLALDYYFKYLKMEEELGNKPGIASSFTLIGSLYTAIYEQGDSSKYSEVCGWAVDNPEQLLDTAFYYQQKAYALNKELNTQFIMANTLLGIGSILSLKNDNAQATKYYKQAIQLSDSIGALQEGSKAHSGLAECYENLGNHKLALEHYKQYATLKDSVFNEEKSKDLGRLEAKHEFELAETKRQRIEEEQAVREEEQKSRRDNLQYSGILIFIVLLFASVFFIGRFSIPIRLAEGMIFFSFLLFFEFTLVLLDPYIEQYSAGAPAIKLAFNALLAGLIFPLHSFFESKLKQRVKK